jgi:GH43 family beta-xylosidase
MTYTDKVEFDHEHLLRLIRGDFCYHDDWEKVEINRNYEITPWEDAKPKLAWCAKILGPKGQNWTWIPQGQFGNGCLAFYFRCKKDATLFRLFLK